MTEPVSGDNEQTPALPEDMIRTAAEVLRKHYDQEFDASHLMWNDFAGQARDVLTAALAGRTVLEPSRPPEEQWFVWAGGPDPDNAAMRCLRDDEADAREYWQWVSTASGSGIARRSVYFGPWEIVAAEVPTCEHAADRIENDEVTADEHQRMCLGGDSDD